MKVIYKNQPEGERERERERDDIKDLGENGFGCKSHLSDNDKEAQNSNLHFTLNAL